MKLHRFFFALISILLVLTLPSCAPAKKRITVVVREAGSGTREGFDLAVTDGTHFLQERSPSGKRIYRSVKDAVVQTKTGAVLSTVVSDAHAIGYVSLDSVKGDVKLLSINGVFPSEESVSNGTYPISRPFVILTSRTVSLTPLAADFLSYLKSDLATEHVRAAGCVFLSDPHARAGEGEAPIPVSTFTPKDRIPDGGRLVLRGSTSLERLATSAARGYAAHYGVDPAELFDIQLEGSSIGRRAVEDDRVGNVIGLSSVDVHDESIESFRLCLDAIAVIVNPENRLTDLSLATLYDIFSGKIRHFDEIGVNT